jgi:hypothetical protein
MCTGTTTHADIRVSVQDRNARDRAAGHLAAAVLVDGDAVLVPNPGKRLLDPSVELEILIFPADPKAHLPIERIDAWKWSPFQLTGASAPLATVGRLRHHSHYSAQIGEVEPRELAAVTQKLGGDLWAALDRLGAVPPGIADISGKLLTEISRVEREQRRPRRSEHQFDSYDQLVGGFCIFFCFCSDHRAK